MIKHPPRIYWDACSWISYINQEMPGPEKKFTDKRFEMCRATLRRAEADEIEVVTSAFTLAEVCKRAADPSVPAINLPAFFDQKYILLVSVDKVIGTKAQNLQLAGIYGIKPADAIHLASAIVHDVPVLHTFDGPLLGLDQKLKLNNGNALRICKPTEEAPMPDLLKAMQP